MASPIEILKLIVRGDTKAARAELDKLGRQSRTVGKRMSAGFDRAKRAVFSLRGAIAALGLAAVGRQIIRNTVEQERVLRQMDTVLKSTAGAAGLTKEELIGMSAELQNLTTFGDEAIQNMQNLLLTFTNIREGGDIFRDTTEAVLDMSSALGEDLRASATRIGKAIQDPLRGMSELREVGVAFTDEQIAMAKQMVETGDLMGAQRLILKELAIEYGGSARAARDTFGGALKGLSNAFGDLLEGRGGNLNEAKDRLEELTALFQDPATVQAFDSITGAIITMAGKLAELAVGFSNVGKGLGILIAQAQTGVEDPNDLLGSLNAQIKRNEDELRSFQARLQSITTAGEEFAPLGEVKRLRAAIALRERGLELLRETKRLHDEGRLQRDPFEFTQAGSEPSAADGSSPTGSPAFADEAAQKAAEARQKAVRSLISSLQEQAATEGSTAREIALYRLEQQGASEIDIRRANALLDVIEAHQALAEANEERKRADAEAAAEAEKLTLQREAFVDAVRQELDPTRELRQELELLRETQAALVESGNAAALSAEKFAAAEARLKDEIEKARQGLDKFGQFGIQAARNAQDAFADFLFDPFQGGVDGMVQQFADAMRRMVAEALAAKALSGFETIFGIGDTDATVAHSGGVVGRIGTTRSVSSAAFIGAPKFHSGGRALGLGADEVPAILQKGERVLNLDDTRKYDQAMSGGARVNMTVVTQDAQSFERSSRRIQLGMAQGMQRSLSRDT